MSDGRVSARTRWGYRVAMGLTLSRLAMAIPFVAIGLAGGPGWLAALILVAGFLSDVFDGIVARRFGASTAALRRMDSAADTVFYLGAAYCAWGLHADVVRANAIGIILIIATQALDHAVEVAKFRREASYHAYTAKLWGVALFSALVALFVLGRAELLPVAIGCGLLSHAENLAITAVLPEWRHDVPTVFHAWRIRRAVLSANARTERALGD